MIPGSKIRVLAVSGCIALTAYIVSCSNTDRLAGTSEIGNPEKVSAIIVDSTRKGVPGVAVRLVPCDYNPLKDTANRGLPKTASSTQKPSPADTSDANGKVLIQARDSGHYNLVATSDHYKYRLYVTDILVQNKKPAEWDTVFLDTVFLREPGTVLVTIDSSVYIPGSALVVIGSFVSAVVQQSGVAAVSVPCGLITLRYVNAAGDSIAGGPAFDTVLVGEGAVVDRTGIAESITAPSTPVGANAGARAVAYAFASGGAVSNKGFPVQYRFDWGDTTFSAWSADSSATHAWAAADTYSIRSQARSTLDTSVASLWSAANSIIIVDTPLITAPYQPACPDSVLVRDSSAAFATGGSTSNFAQPVSYRFDWGDATISAWSADSSATHAWTDTGIFIVTAQARGATDTGIVSPLSIGKSILVVTQHTITTPARPISADPADSIVVKDSVISFTSGGSTSNLGQPISYRFDWGDATFSVWSSDSAASHAWAAAGTYPVTAQARSATDTGTVSPLSPVKSIQVVAQHTVTAPQKPTGSDTLNRSVTYTFNTGGASSNLGDQVQYRFDWGDTTFSAWSISTTGTHSWAAAGNYSIRAQARSSKNTTVISGFSGIFTVSVF